MTYRAHCLLFGFVGWFASAMFADAAEHLVYFGTTAEKKNSEGIYFARFDTETGKLGPVVLAAKITSPTFINFHPTKPVLYAIGETSDDRGRTSGEVAAFALDVTTGGLTLINKQPSGGDALCYILADTTGCAVLAAGYRDGSVMTFPIQPDGSLGPRATLIAHAGSSVHPRQKSPHAHNIDLDPANHFALVADLGIDQVRTYKFDSARKTIAPSGTPFKTRPGAGPRHVAFDPSGRHAYIINELDNTLIAADYDSTTGGLKEKQTLPLLPPAFTGTSTAAEIVVHPSGRFLYASNRGFDSLAVFTIAPETGTLTFLEYMREGVSHPRHFAIDPTGRWLLCANRDTSTTTVYRIAPDTGRLLSQGAPTAVPASTCVKFYPVQ